MIRVLQVLGSLQRGGAETFVMNVYRRIDKSEIQFDFLVKERVGNGYEDEAQGLGAHVYVVESAKKIGPMRYMQEQRRVMQEHGPYVAVHSHANYLSGMTLRAARKAQVKTRIAHSHNTRFPSGTGVKLSKMMIPLYATKLYACSEEAGRALFGRHDFEVINNGIEWERFANCGLKPKDPSHPFTIVQMGRFAEVKNQAFTVLMLSRLAREVGPDKLRLSFVGDGPLLDDVRGQVRDLGISDYVNFAGSVDCPERWLGDADVVVMPSIYEGLPLAALEAQCSASWVLLSDNVSQEADLGMGNCLFLPLDLDAWVDEVSSLMNAPAPALDYSRIRDAVYDRGYSPDLAASTLSSYYERAAYER